MTIVAETNRLIIRWFEPEDIDALYALYEDDDAKRYSEALSLDRDEEKEKLESYIRYVYGFYGFGLFAVCLKDTGALIGRCGVWMTELDDEPEMEIGYLIRKDYRHQGFGYESVMAILEFAAEETDIHRIIAKIHPENQSSLKLIENAGFEKIGSVTNEASEMFLYAKPIEHPWDETEE